MRVDASPIVEWRPRWKWFKLGAVIEVENFPRIVIGFGIISFEAHLFTWQDGSDIDMYIACPLGYAGVHFEFTKKEEQENEVP